MYVFALLKRSGITLKAEESTAYF